MKLDLTKIEELYNEGIEKHGIDSKSVGWKDKESQSLRFEKLLSVVDDTLDDVSVNELGCGYGELFNYMVCNKMSVGSYRGYDISEKMLSAAKKVVSDNRASFSHADEISSMADYSFSSGIFNVRFDISDDRGWEEYIKTVINNMSKYSKKGFAFNLLSTFVDYQEDHLYYGDPLFFFDYCKRHVSKYVNLIHDYNLYEWTICVKK